MPEISELPRLPIGVFKIGYIAAGGLDGERIRNVRVLERFALFEVPADAVRDSVEVRGRTVALEPIRT